MNEAMWVERNGKRIIISQNHGNDETGDGTWGKPFKTFQRAMREVKAGDTVNVEGGIYDQKDAPEPDVNCDEWVLLDSIKKDALAELEEVLEKRVREFGLTPNWGDGMKTEWKPRYGDPEEVEQLIVDVRDLRVNDRETQDLIKAMKIQDGEDTVSIVMDVSKERMDRVREAIKQALVKTETIMDVKLVEQRKVEVSRNGVTNVFTLPENADLFTYIPKDEGVYEVYIGKVEIE